MTPPFARGDRLVPFERDGIACTVLDVRDGLVFLDWPGGVIAVPAQHVAETHHTDDSNHEEHC